MKKLALLILTLFTIGFIQAQTKKSKNMKKKILFVVTSHDKKGDTGESTGYYLGEVSHPWEVLHNAGYEIDFVSPKGGTPPVDGFDLKDPVNKEFWENTEYKNNFDYCLKRYLVYQIYYSTIFFAGVK